MADLIVRSLGLQSYLPIWQQMQTFTDTRDAQTPDEIWVLEHHPVFTQGQAGKPEHLLNPSNIPVIQTDRGGQVTYHGPGQLVVYLLLDLRRLKIGVRDVVTLMETAVIDQLARIGINANAKEDAPGVYVKGEKVASLGLRVRRGCTFHGLALNVDMDLMPFQQINPCGYAGLQMTQVVHFAPNVKIAELSDSLVNYFTTHLGYQTIGRCQTLLRDVTQ